MKFLSRNLCLALLVSFVGTRLVARQKTAGQQSTVSMPHPVHLLTSDDRYYDWFPSVSPSGKKVVFSRQPAGQLGKDRLWVIALDQGEAHPLSPENFPLNCTRAAWSPDGTTIAFRAGRADEELGGIWLMSSEGSNLRRLTDEEKFNDRAPAWSPDGKWLVFSRGPITRGDTDDLWQVTIDGWERQLTRGKDKWDTTSSVAPDGRQIAFASRPVEPELILDFSNTNIWVMTIQGGEATAIQFTFGGGQEPAWSPDGAWIAFISARGGGQAVYLQRVAGGPVIRVTEIYDGGKGHPAWSPDGNWIVYELVTFTTSSRTPIRSHLVHSHLVHSHLALVDVRDIVQQEK